MTLDAWITLAAVIAVMTILVRGWLPPSAAVGAGMVAVLAAGVVTPTQALSGFSNPAPITIAALYIVSEAVRRTGVLAPLIDGGLGDGRSVRRTLLRLTAPVTAASAIFNNTPIVAMLAPQVDRWATRRGQSPSRYLMPLSFAAVLGGVVTLMGTATNVVASGLLEAAGLEPIGFFEITRIGLPVAVVGIALIAALSPGLVPERRSARTEALEEYRDFSVAMRVEAAGPLDGATVESAGLRHLRGVFLARIVRDGSAIAPVRPGDTLRADDELQFIGRASDIVDLEEIRGLRHSEQSQVLSLEAADVAYYQVVVGPASPLVGHSIREFGFRGRYQAAVIAIHRAGERVDAKLGDVVVKVGDTLLVMADHGWGRRWGDQRDFLLSARLGDAARGPSRRAVVPVLAVVAAVIITAATGLVPLVTAALVGAGLLVVVGAVNPSEARRAVDLDVILTIAAAFGLAEAMVSSGLAATIGDAIVSALEPAGTVGVLAGLVLATTILKELVTNKAAILILLPIAIAAATDLGIDPRGYALAVTVAAGTPFLTPIGFQTNLMVYGPGGYRFTDYLRLGVPLTATTIGLILLLVPRFWPW